MAKYDRKATSFANNDKFYDILEDFENNWIEKLEKMEYEKVIELLVQTAANAKNNSDDFYYAFFIESYLYYYRKLTEEEQLYVAQDVFWELGENEDAQRYYADYVEYDVRRNGGDYWKFDDVEEITLDDYYTYYYD